MQEQQRFINENKVIAMTGSTSSAVAVALNKFAEREKMLYLVAISGSNDTTGKDCARYSFRQCFYGQTAASAIGPVLIKNFGKNRKAAFMTPDYTYGHTVTKSVNDYLSTHGGWKMVTNQVSPLGTQDFSQFLTNIANSGAEFIVNVNWGRDAVLSIQQAKQFGLTPKMTMVIPYQIPFLAKEVGPELTEGVFAATDFWWTLEDKYPLAKMFVEAFHKKYGYRPEWGAENAYMQFAIWARMVSEAGTFYPPDVIKQYEKGETFPSMVGDVHFRPRRSPARPSGHHRPRQGAEGHEEQGGLLGGARGRAGRAADAEAGRLRLQARFLHLTAASSLPARLRRGEGPSSVMAGPQADAARPFARCSPVLVCECPDARASIPGIKPGMMLRTDRCIATKCGRQRDQLGQFHFAMLQRAGARRAARADLVRPDDHLRHARRAQPRARRDVHAGRLCRLARLHLYGLLHRRRHRGLAVRHAGRRGDGAGIIRHFYTRPHEDQLLVTFGLGIVFVEAVRFFFGSLSKMVPPPPSFVGIINLGFMFYPTYRSRCSASSRSRCWRSTSCSTAPASA